MTAKLHGQFFEQQAKIGQQAVGGPWMTLNEFRDKFRALPPIARWRRDHDPAQHRSWWREIRQTRRMPEPISSTLRRSTGVLRLASKEGES